MNINYGSILKLKNIISEGEIETVMLINNTSAGNDMSCCGLDLLSKEILFDCKNIDDFMNTYKNNIVEKVGEFGELFSL